MRNDSPGFLGRAKKLLSGITNMGKLCFFKAKSLKKSVGKKKWQSIIKNALNVDQAIQ